jgi:hypothetical protein
VVSNVEMKNKFLLNLLENVTYDKLFSDNFIKTNTKFNTFSELLDKYGIDSEEEFISAVKTSEFNQFIKMHTIFNSSKEMFEKSILVYFLDGFELDCI